MPKKKIAIDLLWYKPNKIAGIGSVVRNLLDGLYNQDLDENEYYLITSNTNKDEFKKYYNNEKFYEIHFKTNTYNPIYRSLWRLFFYNHNISKYNFDLLFFPTYEGPIGILFKNYNSIVVIHDLQAIHFPKYHSLIKRIWLKINWIIAINKANKIIAISNFVKNDILKNFNVNENKVDVIYNPISLGAISNWEILKNEYFIYDKIIYTVSTLLPHKNLITIIKAFKLLISNNDCNKFKLVITGVVNKNDKKVIDRLLYELNLTNSIVLTGYISNEQRNAFYSNCDLFVFPSLFEGFGMPTIEAMQLGANVLTTKMGSIMEVTKGRANYVEDPLSVIEWSLKMKELIGKKKNNTTFQEYSINTITSKYIEIMNKTLS